MAGKAPSPKKANDLAGYPMIENLLETEDFARVNKSFAEAYQNLEKKVADKSLGLSGRKKVKQAMQAYELTVELIRQLVGLKAEMTKNQKAPQEKAGK